MKKRMRKRKPSPDAMLIADAIYKLNNQLNALRGNIVGLERALLDSNAAQWGVVSALNGLPYTLREAFEYKLSAIPSSIYHLANELKLLQHVTWWRRIKFTVLNSWQA